MRKGEVAGPRGALHYALSGRTHAPTLVLLHPLGADLDVFDPVLPELERFFGVLRIDLAGHGGSRASGAASMAEFATDILAVCDSLGIQRAHYCGISLGGAIALELASAHPARVQRLVLANTAPSFPDAEGWDQRIRTVREQGLNPIIEAMPSRWFTTEFRAQQGELIEGVATRMRQVQPGAYVAACEALKVFDRSDTLTRLQPPVLVLAGARDAVTTVEQTESWSAQIPGADVVVLDAGHLAVMEQPADFAAALIDFLRE